MDIQLPLRPSSRQVQKGAPGAGGRVFSYLLRSCLFLLFAAPEATAQCDPVGLQQKYNERALEMKPFQILRNVKLQSLCQQCKHWPETVQCLNALQPLDQLLCQWAVVTANSERASKDRQAAATLHPNQALLPLLQAIQQLELLLFRYEFSNGCNLH